MVSSTVRSQVAGRSMEKSHHYSPVLHLRNFVGNAPAGHIWTYDKQSGNSRSSIPEETGFETHFYSVEKDDGTKDTTIEKFLSDVESKAAPVYRGLLEGKLPEGQPKADFANFLAAMYSRTPSMRRMFGEMQSRGLQIHNYAYGANDKAFEAFVKRSGGPPLDEKGLEALRSALLDPSQFEIQVSRESTLRCLGVMDELTPIFFRMGWTVVYAAHGYFITCDNALTKAVNPKSVSPFYGDGGFMNKTVEVTFPLSPKVMLLMTWAEKPRSQLDAPREAADGWNRTRASHAERFLYAHLDDKRIAQLAAEQAHSRPGMTMQGFGPKKFAKTTIRRKLSRSGAG
ncbi:MAG TPA: DUF4238 domain-containing protein [Pseudolabrys sp.]|nr:DUF4238 domain-containing protein [Pseudolabrys sp.]